MKYEVVNIAQQYKEGNIDATEAMNTIVTYIFPEITEDVVYIKRLVAFMWDLETSDLLSTVGRTQRLTDARIMFTYLIKKKYDISSKRIGEIVRIDHNTVRARLLRHDLYMENSPEYKKIYNIISKIL